MPTATPEKRPDIDHWRRLRRASRAQRPLHASNEHCRPRARASGDARCATTFRGVHCDPNDHPAAECTPRMRQGRNDRSAARVQGPALAPFIRVRTLPAARQSQSPRVAATPTTVVPPSLVQATAQRPANVEHNERWQTAAICGRATRTRSRANLCATPFAAPEWSACRSFRALPSRPCWCTRATTDTHRCARP